MNPYLTEDNQPSEVLEYTLDYYGISLDEFKIMTDEQVIGIVKRFSDVLNDGRITKSGVGTQKEFISRNVSGFQPNPKTIPGYNQHGDSGSFSRYFSLDSWWAERIKQLPESVQKTFPFLIVPKASKSEKNRGCEDVQEQGYENVLGSLENPLKRIENGVITGDRHNKAKKNFHPTVKPISLFSYLITLGSREGDIVLDPYLGSGTTKLAAEILGRRWIGFEISSEYCKLAEKRIDIERAQIKLDI